MLYNLIQQFNISFCEKAFKLNTTLQLKENLSENYNAYQGPVEAKFVVIPTVTDMSFGGEYEKSYTTKNKKGEVLEEVIY